MKTAISVPDDVFDKAEATAKRLKISRSELYSRALQEFLDAHSPDRVTAAWDAVIEELGQPDESVSALAARRVFEVSAIAENRVYSAAGVDPRNPVGRRSGPVKERWVTMLDVTNSERPGLRPSLSSRIGKIGPMGRVMPASFWKAKKSDGESLGSATFTEYSTARVATAWC